MLQAGRLVANGLDTKKGTGNGELETHLRLESFGMFFFFFFPFFFFLLLILFTFSTGTMLRHHYQHAGEQRQTVRSERIPGLGRGNGEQGLETSASRVLGTFFFLFFFY